jgi:hypothetical protein
MECAGTSLLRLSETLRVGIFELQHVEVTRRRRDLWNFIIFTFYQVQSNSVIT